MSDPSDGTPDLRVLLMGYLDGELDAADRARVEAALETDAELRREHEEMRALKDMADRTGADTSIDAELDRFWGDVYNRIERHTGWMFLLAGLLGLTVLAAYFFLTSPENHWAVKTAGTLAGLGSLVLFWSLWRERRRIEPHDRYSREVDR